MAPVVSFDCSREMSERDLAQMLELPTDVALTDLESGEVVFGSVVDLTREAAKQGMDLTWWNGLTAALQDIESEPDRHWRWAQIISKYQNKPNYVFKCIQMPDRSIQAAMVLRVGVASAMQRDRLVVFVDRLATAPRNRAKLAINPSYRGGGTALLTYAIALSYSLGFMGAVNLFAIANESFYEDFGFQPTDVISEDERLWELPTPRAIEHLRSRGLIDA